MNNLTSAIDLTEVSPHDAEALVDLRITAMRESLERIGRFDPDRARHRFMNTFEPAFTRHIELGHQRVGFVVVKPEPQALSIEHLYIHPDHQGKGIGGEVLRRIFNDADSKGMPTRVGALRGSDSNRFYSSHGFALVEEGEWDLYYLRPAIEANKQDAV